jgi:hypothetical protein
LRACWCFLFTFIFVGLVLFIYLWFEDAVASNGGLIGEKLIFNNFEGIGRGET